MELRRAGLTAFMIAISAGLGACVDSEVGGFFGDLVPFDPDGDGPRLPLDTTDASLPPIDPLADADITIEDSVDVVDAGCSDSADCVDVLGPLSPCLVPVCDPGAGVCAAVRRPDCCESAADCPLLDAPCVELTCPVPGDACVPIDTCPSCSFDSDCDQTAPACTRGRCSEGSCIYESNETCCVDDADCDDADLCTDQVCSQGLCSYFANGLPGCCTETPTIQTSFSPPPAFAVESTHPEVGWFAIDTDFTPSPPSALYMGNPDTFRVSTGGEAVETSVTFDLGPVRAGSETEVKFQLYLDLRSAPEVDRFRVVLRRPNGQQRVLYSKGEAPLQTWHPIKRVIESGSNGNLRLSFHYISGEPTDTPGFGVLVDDLEVRTGCNQEVGCQSDAQCTSDDPCQRGFCDAAGDCGVAPIEGCCASVSDCPSPGPCQEVACVNNVCLRETAPNCCTADDDCLIDDPCVVGRCLPDGDCELQPIPECCAGPDCPCDPEVSAWDFEASAQGWSFDPAVMGFGWVRAEISAPGQPRVLYFGNPAGPTGDPGFPMIASAESPPFTISANAQLAQLEFAAFIALRPFPPADELVAEVVADSGESATLWQLGPNVPRNQPINLAGEVPSGLFGQALRVRLTYRSLDGISNQGAGILIDDVAITALCGVAGCDRADDCVDGDPCTEDLCNAQTGACFNPPIPGCDTCETDADCADGQPCTQDLCVDGSCLRLPVSDCCVEDAECNDDDACTEDRCEPATSQCTFSPIPDCGGCRSNEDCDDGDVCTQNLCGDEGQCVAIPLPDCCSSAADCDDRNRCTEDSCLVPLGLCTRQPIPGCCLSDDDCPSDDPCFVGLCDADAAICRQIPVSDPACGACEPGQCDDGDPCTADACDGVTGECTRLPIDECCTGPGQCSDGDLCTVDLCQGNQCIHAPLPIAGCGTGTCDDDGDCDDGNACTDDECTVDAQCQNTPVFGCCDTPSDCDDDNLCTDDTCLAGLGLCLNPPTGCNDFDPCTTDSCDPELGCVHAPEPGCCVSAADCDDGDACTFDSCQGGECAHEGTADCCGNASDCDDGRPCTTDLCVAGACRNEAVAGCCTTAAECNDGDACTEDTCTDAGCVNTPTDCNDGDPCTEDRCANGDCQNTPRNCDDADPCTQDLCGANGCQHQPIAGCCAGDDCCAEGTVVSYDFTDGAPGWSISPPAVAGASSWFVSSTRRVSAPNSLYAGNPETGSYDDDTVHLATTPAIALPDAEGIQLDFAVWIDTELNFDPFTVRVRRPGQAPVTVWEYTSVPQQQWRSWVDARVDLSAFAGQTIRLRFRHESDFLISEEGIYIDDVQISALCRPVEACTSDAQCFDGDACTRNVCLGGRCASSPVVGCCSGDSECDDGYACTTDSCDEGACVNRLVEDCCVFDAECDDGNRCTSDRCDDETNTCVFTGSDFDCCADDADCADNDACSVDICTASGECDHDPLLIPECCQAGTFFSEPFPAFALTSFDVFTDGSDVHWQIWNGRSSSAPFALYYGNPETGNYDSGARTFGTARSQPIDIPISGHAPVLAFNVWTELGSFFFDDLLSARITFGGNSLTVWERTELPFGSDGVWLPVEIALPEQVIGETIRVEFVFDSVDDQGNQDEGVYIDDVQLLSTCQ